MGQNPKHHLTVFLICQRLSAYNSPKGEIAMTYRKTKKQERQWGLWDILLVQLILVGFLGLALWLGVEPLKELLTELLHQPALTQQDLTPLKEAAETFLHQYIYEEGKGGAVSDGGNVSTAKVSVSSPLCVPLTGVISSAFGEREHPTTGEADFHTGLDIAAKEGTAIHAAADGIVENSGWHDSYGNYILLKHSDNFRTLYAHCQKLIAKSGDLIRRGERIALVGSTGFSTGPHLHFECIVDGMRVEPYQLLC